MNHETIIIHEKHAHHFGVNFQKQCSGYVREHLTMETKPCNNAGTDAVYVTEYRRKNSLH